MRGQTRPGLVRPSRAHPSTGLTIPVGGGGARSSLIVTSSTRRIAQGTLSVRRRRAAGRLVVPASACQRGTSATNSVGSPSAGRLRVLRCTCARRAHSTGLTRVGQIRTSAACCTGDACSISHTGAWSVLHLVISQQTLRAWRWGYTTMRVPTIINPSAKMLSGARNLSCHASRLTVESFFTLVPFVVSRTVKSRFTLIIKDAIS